MADATTAILVRHGNTFDSSEAAVYVGARTDLPLVESGRRQAEAVADAIAVLGLRPTLLLAGPLMRTRETAAIVAGRLGAARPCVDTRLREIDYGSWEGRSKDEVCASDGGCALANFEANATWPDDAGWQPTQAEVVADIANLFDEIRTGTHRTVCIVTSNTILRLAARYADPEKGPQAMQTGRLSIVRLDGARISIEAWNLGPGSVVGCR